MRIVAIDPGRESGWASFSFDYGYTSGQVPYRIWPFLEIAHATEPITQLVLEVDHQQHEVSDFAVYEVIGVVREFAAQNHIPIKEQSPSEGKFYFTDERLEERGLLRTPRTRWRHANDGMRHLLHYMQFKAGMLREVRK